MGRIDPFIRELTSDEPVLNWFGMTIVEAHAGMATITLTVDPHQVNGNRMAHGGVVFAVADQAFAMAANTLLHYAATADATIQYLAPSRAGDLLTARARTTYHDDRRAVVDVEVVTADRVVAIYRGTARATRRG
ncbi:hotdog fold thioesterase [Microbacterium sp. QXD-8]|uniref:Hotdog fold thioesterase n=1 Tax=Microbacterium psychrotolerans TaxID=3068321 RepID=A0ABU0YXT0_9MICO|nr:hotdog fold thioesterase [Microbacterium sp. QXD-8]MDQ7877137.1 hotdog fold thioesterase [Microbacterium sp. QXD-8]